MAILFSEGFDEYLAPFSGTPLAQLLSQQWTLNTIAVADIQTTYGALNYTDTRLGLDLNGTAAAFGTTPTAWLSKTLTPGNATCIVGVALALFQIPSVKNSFLYIATGGAGTVTGPPGGFGAQNTAGIQLSVVLNTDKTISVYQGYYEGGGATLLGTSVTQLDNILNTIHRFQYLEVKAVIDGSNGSVDIRLSTAYNNFASGDALPAYPSASILSLTGVNTGPAGTSGGRWWDTVTFSTGSVNNDLRRIDDIYIADGTGANADFIGPVAVVLAGSLPYATIASTYESGGSGAFSNVGLADGGKNVGQGTTAALGRYSDDGASSYVLASVLNGLFSTHVDVPQAPPFGPTYWTPDRGIAGVVAFYAMKAITFLMDSGVTAQGLVRFPGGVGGTDYFGRQMNPANVNRNQASPGVPPSAPYDQGLEDPWDTDPTGVQWTRAHIYSELLGANPAAAEFGIKSLALSGTCQLGQVFLNLVYGHFIQAQETVTSVSPSHAAPGACGIEIHGAYFLPGDEGSICAPGTSVVSSDGTLITCCLPNAGQLNVGGVPFDPGPYDVVVAGSVPLAFGFTGDVMSTIAIPFNDAVKQFFDSNGKPLALGFVKTFVAGSATPQPTYSDPALTAQNGAAGVAQLDSAGKITMYMLPTTYKVTVTDVNGVVQDGYPIDNVPGSIWPGVIGAQVTTTPAVGANSLGHQFTATMNKASSGTHALFAANYFAAPTIGAGGAALTEASTVYIAGPPTLGSSIYSLHVAAGIAKFDGAVQVPGGFTGSVGFYGTAPIAQQVLATGAGHSVDNVITALQALGLVKQS